MISSRALYGKFLLKYQYYYYWAVAKSFLPPKRAEMHGERMVLEGVGDRFLSTCPELS